MMESWLKLSNEQFETTGNVSKAADVEIFFLNKRIDIMYGCKPSVISVSCLLILNQ